MQRNDIEEKFARCYKCTLGLTYLDNLLYGNRCTFCCEETENMGFLFFLRIAILNFKIYQELLRIRNKYGQERGRLIFLSILGVSGYSDPNEIKTIKGLRQVLAELKQKRS